MSRGRTGINHRLFADDCVIFRRARPAEWKKIQGILGLYERASEQFLNLQKTAIFFSTNTVVSIKSQIQRAAGVPECGSYEKYLGLPAMVGRSRYNTFRSLKERV